MRKKITVLFASICMLSLSACSGSKVQDEAIKDYQTIMNTSQAITSSHIDGKFLFTMEKENMNFKVSLDGNFITQEKPQFAIDLSAAVNGIRIENLAKIYMKDHTIYANVLEQEKMSMPLDKNLSKITKPTKQPIDKEAIKKAFKELTVTKENDKKVIKGFFSDTALVAMTKQVNKSYQKDINVKNISNAQIKFTSNENNFLENLYMNMKVTYQMDNTSSKDSNKDYTMDIEILINLTNQNNVESITFPDFNDYKKGTDLDKGSKYLLDQMDGNAV